MELHRASLHGLRSFFPPTSLMFLIMDIPFFKHYTPQLAHNCCPCIMNYASYNANPGSLALDKSQAVEEAGVITKTIQETRRKRALSGPQAVLPRLPHVRSRLTPTPLGFNEQLLGFEQALCAKQCANTYHASTSLFCTILGGWDYHLFITHLSLEYSLLLEFLGFPGWGLGEVHLCDINGKKGLFIQVTNVTTKDGLKLFKKRTKRALQKHSMH